VSLGPLRAQRDRGESQPRSHADRLVAPGRRAAGGCGRRPAPPAGGAIRRSPCPCPCPCTSSARTSAPGGR
jgi:hypothetical protein